MPVPKQLEQFAFKPGNPGGGRAKERETLQVTLDKLGFDTVREAVALFNHPKSSNYVKWDILKELMQYQYQKQKSVTIGNEDGTQNTIHISWDKSQPNITSQSV